MAARCRAKLQLQFTEIELGSNFQINIISLYNNKMSSVKKNEKEIDFKDK